ncbi:MAG: GH1 family beta-glucosidase [Acidimicrobiia bacterium]|nr:GH1 family beta-glucosidase [Acidimicrobiia bacterium]
MQTLPDDFVWGVATAAYQIEGAPSANGRGESIWDRFAHTPGKTRNGDTGDAACEHFYRWESDIELMQQLGVQAYRFSIAWPRIFPHGSENPNLAGLGFYDRLVDKLLEAGITPSPTLYHWDLPQALEDDGGWVQRRTAYAFAHYAEVVGERLGDRVQQWWTINEPWCVAELGYFSGDHAPGRRNRKDALAAAHHTLLAHGLGMEALRRSAPAAQIGLVTNVECVVPRSAHPADIEAAELAHQLRNTWYVDPVLKGEYPERASEHYQWDAQPVRPGDMEIISAPMDSLGVNYYSRQVAGDERVDDADRPPPLVNANLPRTTMGWEIYPEGLRDILMRFQQDYELPPVYVTESGVAFADVEQDGAIHDADRRAYLESHFAAAAEAHAAGVDLRGYFVWSLMDNFEWQHGYSQRFGLVWVDYATQERIIKDSGYWFASMVKSS